METPTPSHHNYWWGFGLIRLGLGWIFLWAFLDKLFGLGFATEAGKAWLDGASPTAGFLNFGTAGPFADFYASMADSVLVEWLYMLGLLLVGVALIFGIGLRIAGWAGGLMMLLFYSASLPPTNNPFMDDHIIYFLLLAGIALRPGTFGWASLHPGWIRVIKNNRWLE